MLHYQSAYVDTEGRHRYTTTSGAHAEAIAEQHAAAVAAKLVDFPKGASDPPAASLPEGVVPPHKFDEYVAAKMRHAVWSTPEPGMGEAEWRDYHSVAALALHEFFPTNG